MNRKRYGLLGGIRVLSLAAAVVTLVSQGALAQVDAGLSVGDEQLCYTADNSCDVVTKPFGAPCVCGSQGSVLSGRTGSKNNADLGHLLSLNSSIDLSAFAIEYFKKDLDGNKVLDALSGLGITPILKTPVRKDVLTDTVIFSSDVPPEIVKFIAIALIKGGVAVKAIIYYGKNLDRASPLPFRVRLLQLGTAGVNGLRDLSEQDILMGTLPLVKK